MRTNGARADNKSTGKTETWKRLCEKPKKNIFNGSATVDDRDYQRTHFAEDTCMPRTLATRDDTREVSSPQNNTIKPVRSGHGGNTLEVRNMPFLQNFR